MSSLLIDKQKLAERLRTTILFPFLLPVFFVLHVERYYTGAVPLRDVVELIAEYLTGAGLIYIGLRLFIKNKVVAGIITLLLLILFLYWWEIIPLLIHVFHTSQNFRNHVYFLLALFAVIGGIAWLIDKQNIAVTQRITSYINLLFLIYIFVEISLLAFAFLSGKMDNGIIDQQLGKREDAVLPHAGKDIYFLLFDEYASNESLKIDWHIDNSEIAGYLAGKGFYLPLHTHSNYNLTQFSMTSMFNMGYLQGYSEPVNRVFDRDYQYCVPALDHPRVVTVLERAGYQFSSYSIFSIAGQPRYELFSRLVFKRQLVTDHTFYRVLKEFYSPNIFSRKFFQKQYDNNDSVFYQTHTYNQKNLSQVLAKARKRSNHPQFVYAHFLLPHPPFYYKADGSLIPPDIYTDDIQKGSYASNVRQANRVMNQMVDSILSYSHGDAVILIMGDHGFRANYKNNPAQSFPAFNALYFPDRNYAMVPDSMTNVNLFRIVLNKFCGMQYPMLPDKECFLKEE